MVTVLHALKYQFINNLACLIIITLQLMHSQILYSNKLLQKKISVQYFAILLF